MLISKPLAGFLQGNETTPVHVLYMSANARFGG